MKGLLAPALRPSVLAGCQADQRGRNVTIYNESGEPLCPGTAAQMDDLLEQVFLDLGENLPDAPFVDYDRRKEELRRLGPRLQW